MTTQIPHAKCNWTIPGRIMIGAYPRMPDVPTIIATGITVFVNLTDNVYDLQDYKDIQVINFPIPTNKTRNRKETVVLIDELKSLYDTGKSLYIHCNGGIGRAGLICSCLIGKINGLDAVDAIKFVDDSRSSRLDQSRSFVPLPESNMQIKQVGSILGVKAGTTLPDRSDKSYIKVLKGQK